MDLFVYASKKNKRSKLANLTALMTKNSRKSQPFKKKCPHSIIGPILTSVSEIFRITSLFSILFGAIFGTFWTFYTVKILEGGS